MIRIFKIIGNSLYPIHKNGEYVLVIKRPFVKLKLGDVVVLQRNKETLIKQIAKIDKENKQLFIIGKNKYSIDSRVFGWVKYNMIIGKVVFAI